MQGTRSNQRLRTDQKTSKTQEFPGFQQLRSSDCAAL
jgi:hypothetical protein